MDIKQLPDNWIWTKLGEISRITDRDHRTPKYVEKGYPLISPTCFTPFGINFSNIKFVEENEFLQFKRKCNPELKEQDLIDLRSLYWEFQLPNVSERAPSLARKTLRIFCDKYDLDNSEKQDLANRIELDLADLKNAHCGA